MRILNIIQCTNLGGMEQSSLRIAKIMREKGHSYRVISLNSSGEMALLLSQEGITTEGIGYHGVFGWRSFFKFKKRLKDVQADSLIMTGHNLMAMYALGALCSGRRVLAMHYHHAGVKPGWQWRMIYRKALKTFNSINFVSEYIRQEAISILPEIEAASTCIHNPYPLFDPPTPDEKRKNRAALDLPLDCPVIGNAGWLIHRKRWDVFLHTADLIRRKIPDAFFVAAGDGPERPEIERLSRELGLTGRIKFLGWRQDMPVFYRAIDVMLFNSDWDAIPSTPLEAISHGVPVVASVINGGLKEIINSGDAGILLDNHDTAMLADGVFRIFKDAEYCGKLVAKSRERLKELCDPDAAADNYLRLLRGKCGGADR